MLLNLCVRLVTKLVRILLTWTTSRLKSILQKDEAKKEYCPATNSEQIDDIGLANSIKVGTTKEYLDNDAYLKKLRK